MAQRSGSGQNRSEPVGSEPDFLQFNDLACETSGGKVIFATDEWFAPAANLLKREPPRFDPSAFTEFGKWMDGWETRRKRTPGQDWCLVQLGVPGLVLGLDVDTSFFTGNHSPHVSIQAGCLDRPPDLSLEGDRTGKAASPSQLAAVAKLGSEAWPQLVGVAPLSPGYADTCHHYLRVDYSQRVTHLRLNLHPDGGVARLRVYGVGRPDWSLLGPGPLDLLALTNGGVCLACSDAHFGHPRNMIGVGRAANMADGWETARRLDRPQRLEVDGRGILQVPGSEWAVFRLGHPGTLSSLEVDTLHFRGNAPACCWLQACLLSSAEEEESLRTRWRTVQWRELLPPQRLQPHLLHRFAPPLLRSGPAVSHVRFCIAPDGGVSRLRLWGQPANQGPDQGPAANQEPDQGPAANQGPDQGPAANQEPEHQGPAANQGPGGHTTANQGPDIQGPANQGPAAKL